MYKFGKYVTGEIKTEGMTILGAIVIPEIIPHTSVKDCFESIMGAGFFIYDQEKVTTYAETCGLSVGCSIHDSLLVGRAISHPKYAK